MARQRALALALFKALASALALRPGRRTIVTNAGNFPTDVYIAEGLCRLLGEGATLRRAERRDEEGRQRAHAGRLSRPGRTASRRTRTGG